MKQLDVRGAKCPLPIIKAKKEIDTMAAGELLEVLATDPGSMADFRGWVKTAKHAALKEQREAKDETGRTIYVHLLERTA
ncbi:MAG TPA: sulfurtransferase TusA family protein [Thermoanaerobaculia bacterium]|jgi:TusA-related sulfurtransferase|nr:sulfurtransferase TusA family protein [Thermoanaerobaculia bacterium]